MLSRIFVEGLVVEVVTSSPGILISGNFVRGFKNGGRDPFRVVVVTGSATGSMVVALTKVVSSSDSF